MKTRMTREELEKAILGTLEEINLTKRKIFLCMDTRVRRKLERKLKELQYLQLWHQDLYDRLNGQDA